MWLHVPSTGSRSALESEGSSWEFGSPSAPGTELWPTLSGTPSPRPCSWRAWRNRSWIKLLYGTISRPFTATLGAAEWTLSLAGSRASHSAQQVASAALTMIGGSGRTSPASSTRSNPASPSSRTSARSSSEDSPLFSTTLPLSGSMRNGRVSAQPKLALPTSASGSGYWPTATAADCRSSGGNPHTTGTHGTTLTDGAVRMWPTPVARDDQKSPAAHMAMKARMPGGPRRKPTSLTVMAKMWPTPTAAEGARGSDPIRSRPNGPSLNGAATTWPTPRSAASRTSRKAIGHGSRSAPSLEQVIELVHGVLPRELDSIKEAPPSWKRLWPAATSGHHDQTTMLPGPKSSKSVTLNPPFVEWLMGWPIGWTDCTRLATESYRLWLQQHSSALRAVLAFTVMSHDR